MIQGDPKAAIGDDVVLSLDASDRNSFRPGEALTGRVRWRLAEPPKSAQVRLFWFTQGRGERDVAIIQASALNGPLAAADDRPFRFGLPAGPYTFSGTLVTLQWAVELVVMPGERLSRVQFDLSPFDEPIVLEKPKDPAKKDR